MRTLIIISLLLYILSSAYSQEGSIKVIVTGTRQVQGSILATIFESGDGFPEDSEKSVSALSVPVSGKSQTFYFHGIPYGTYALAIIHDKNDNGIFDKNFLGIPREGYAVSNNVKGLSAPKFDEAKFELDAKEKVLELNLIYF